MSVREAIFREASAMLVDEGYAAFSLRKLAERIGYSPTTVYRHFRDKDDVVFSVTDEAFERLGKRFAEVLEAECDPGQRVDKLGQAYIDFGLSEPAFYKLMFVHRPDFLLGSRPGSRVPRAHSFLMLQAAVAEAATSSGLTIDVHAMSNALWAMVHGLVSLANSFPEFRADLPKTSALLFALIDRGLQSHATK